MFGKYARFAVCLGIATAITACHQNEAPDPIGSAIHEDVPVALNTTRTLVVQLTGNAADVAAANVKYAGCNGSPSGNSALPSLLM